MGPLKFITTSARFVFQGSRTYWLWIALVVYWVIVVVAIVVDAVL